MEFLSPEWKKFIDIELTKPYMLELRERIKKRRTETNVLPDTKLVFNAFLQCPYQDLKVVILGQDPYPSADDAHGLAFSSLSEETPNSLRIIFKEIYKDFFNGNTGGIDVHQHNNLSQWAWQGVLLLNTVLTVDEGKPKSHAKWGWETFTKEALMFVNDHKHRLVFMLWGAEAKTYRSLINEKRHLVLEAEHPAATAYKGSTWDTKGAFTVANEFIKKHYFNIKPPVNWGVFNKTDHILR